jgi:hypothetical protein
MAAADDTVNLDSVYDMSLQELITIKKNDKNTESLTQYFGNHRPVYTLFPKNTLAFALRVSPEGAYSVSRPDVSHSILENIKKQYINLGLPFTNIRIMDATANNGGDTIRFGLDDDISIVISIEIDRLNFKILQHNVRLYKLDKKVELIHDNMIDFIERPEYDILYVDPPWGGLPRVIDAAKSYTPLTLHLALPEDYTAENEVFSVIASKTKPWKLCCVKVPATMTNQLLSQQVRAKFDRGFKITIVTISNAEINHNRCGVKIVIIKNTQDGSGRKKSKRTKRMTAKRSSRRRQ